MRTKIDHIIFSIIFAFLPVMVVAPKATVIFMTLLAVTMPIKIGWKRLKDCAEKFWRWHKQQVLSVIFLFLWLLVSSLWSENPGHSLETVLKIVGISAVGFLFVVASYRLPPDFFSKIKTALVAGFLAALGLFFIEVFGGMPLTTLKYIIQEGNTQEIYLHWLNRGLSILSIFTWPVLFILLERKSWPKVLALFIATTGLLFFSDAGAAVIALLFGVFVYAVGFISSQKSRTVILLAVTFVTLIGPAIIGKTMTREDIPETVPQTYAYSAYTRLGLWAYSFDTALQRPFTGWGVGGSRFVQADPSAPPEARRDIKLHPHNLALQAFLEGGIVGLLAFCSIIFWIVWKMAHAKGAVRRGTLLATFFSTITVASISYGVWQSWWLAAIWLVLAATFIVLRSKEPSLKPS